MNTYKIQIINDATKQGSIHIIKEDCLLTLRSGETVEIELPKGSKELRT